MGAKFTPEERRNHILTVESLYLSGHSQADIGREIGVSQQQVSKYLRVLQKAWLERLGSDVEATKSRELARIDRLEREYWTAWTKSQEDSETSVEESGSGPLGPTSKHSLTRKGQVGDPRFLQGVMQCVEMRLKIIGGFAPIKQEHSGPNGGPVAITMIEVVKDYGQGGA